jgi:CheY-like chemotaxis protein
MKTDLMIKNRTPREVGDTDAYNLLQVRRMANARGDPLGKTPIGAARRRLRVLVVDDHRAGADMVSKLVNAWGYDVRRGYDGATGLALAVAYRPDVVLLDMLMPDMSGPELAMKLRLLPRLQHCHLVAITGCTDDRRRLHCLEAGVDTYLIKPVHPPLLQRLLMAESKHRMRARQAATTLAVAATNVEQFAGVRSRGPARLAREILPVAVAI